MLADVPVMRTHNICKKNITLIPAIYLELCIWYDYSATNRTGTTHTGSGRSTVEEVGLFRTQMRIRSEVKVPYLELCINIGIKHGFSCINIRQVPWEVLKTEAEGRGFQHLPRDLANINALKKHV